MVKKKEFIGIWKTTCKEVTSNIYSPEKITNLRSPKGGKKGSNFAETIFFNRRRTARFLLHIEKENCESYTRKVTFGTKGYNPGDLCPLQKRKTVILNKTGGNGKGDFNKRVKYMSHLNYSH